MSKIYKFIEYAYLLFAIFFMIEAFLNWNTERQMSYIFIFFSIVAVFMYFFKRKFRKKIENNDN